MSDIVDDIFASAGHQSDGCAECKVVRVNLRTGREIEAANAYLNQHRIRDHGRTTATIECGTMADFYALARTLDEGDRTANMKMCITRRQRPRAMSAPTS